MKLTQVFAAYRHQREQEEQRRRDQVVAEFGRDVRAMADVILRYRRALKQLADAIGWAQEGAPFAVIPPGNAPESE